MRRTIIVAFAVILSGCGPPEAETPPEATLVITLPSTTTTTTTASTTTSTTAPPPPIRHDFADAGEMLDAINAAMAQGAPVRGSVAITYTSLDGALLGEVRIAQGGVALRDPDAGANHAWNSWWTLGWIVDHTREPAFVAPIDFREVDNTAYSQDFEGGAFRMGADSEHDHTYTPSGLMLEGALVLDDATIGEDAQWLVLEGTAVSGPDDETVMVTLFADPETLRAVRLETKGTEEKPGFISAPDLGESEMVHRTEIEELEYGFDAPPVAIPPPEALFGYYVDGTLPFSLAFPLGNGWEVARSAGTITNEADLAVVHEDGTVMLVETVCCFLDLPDLQGHISDFFTDVGGERGWTELVVGETTLEGDPARRSLFTVESADPEVSIDGLAYLHEGGRAVFISFTGIAADRVDRAAVVEFTLDTFRLIDPDIYALMSDEPQTQT